MPNFETLYDFTLPKGYIDHEGNIHKDGKMRLASAVDEIIPLNDQRVKLNPGYLSILLLERVIVKLGKLPKISANIIENLFTSDMTYLQDLYQRINSIEPQVFGTSCPSCNHSFSVNVPFFGEA
ncbi:MAG: phage tail assembly protein [Candidatus Improbicoccus devescovinae]|nr:MAG: phage tail assembly protein [Candidatus Improbicoccus devescovinae]